MEKSVEVLAIIWFGVLGLSHLLQPRFLNLPLAGVIIGFHNTWSVIPVVLTLVGWGLLIKSLIRFCAPRLALRIMARVSVERSREFQVAGAGFLGLAALLGYGVYAH